MTSACDPWATSSSTLVLWRNATSQVPPKIVHVTSSVGEPIAAGICLCTVNIIKNIIQSFKMLFLNPWAQTQPPNSLFKKIRVWFLCTSTDLFMSQHTCEDQRITISSHVIETHPLCCLSLQTPGQLIHNCPGFLLSPSPSHRSMARITHRSHHVQLCIVLGFSGLGSEHCTRCASSPAWAFKCVILNLTDNGASRGQETCKWKQIFLRSGHGSGAGGFCCFFGVF